MDELISQEPRGPVAELKCQSTWRLLGLSIVTVAVYPAHYIARQTRILNDHCSADEQISEGFVIFILIISYLSLALFLGYFFVEEEHPIARASDASDRIQNLVFLIWGFKARNRMNRILGVTKPSQSWFHGLWTFLFTPFYFNYKVNQLA